MENSGALLCSLLTVNGGSGWAHRALRQDAEVLPVPEENELSLLLQVAG